MIIYSSAKLTEKLNVCEGGIERTKAALAKHKLDWNTKLTGRWCLDNLGVHDTIFSMGRVYPESRANAVALLLSYIKKVEEVLLDVEPGLRYDADWPELKLAKKCVSERVRGLRRESKWARASSELAATKAKLAQPKLLDGVDVYLALLSDPLYLAATHSGKAVCELAAYDGKARRTYVELHRFLEGELE